MEWAHSLVAAVALHPNITYNHACLISAALGACGAAAGTCPAAQVSKTEGLIVCDHEF